ncbi:MAG: NAD-dependent epimerase/dehydratase family protein [Thiohalospira sp.]
MQPVLIVGCGDIGRRVGRRFHDARHSVVRLVRSGASAPALTEAGCHAVTADLDHGGDAQRPEPGGLLYWFAPPPPSGRHDPRIRHYLDALPVGEEPARVVLISTSAVYGDCGGAMVTETTPPEPGSDRGQRRLDAEQALSRWAAERGVDIVILRVPGIYAPERLPLERIAGGEPILRPEDGGLTNRIHAEDLADIAVLAGAADAPVGIINVADGVPRPTAEFFDAVADAHDLPRPPRIPLTEARRRFSPAFLEMLIESRVLDISRLRTELGFEPRPFDPTS